MSSKTKRVFQLRKTIPARQQTPQQQGIKQQEPKKEELGGKDTPLRNSSLIQSYQPQSTIQKDKEKEKLYTPLVDGPQLVVDCLQLKFHQKLNNVQVKNITVKNVGSSAIYYEWVFKNLPKMNQSAIKDPKPKFYCHYSSNVIKPGEQVIFSFSFLSEIPGIFIEQCQLVCKPQILTKIPLVKLKGEAYIDDNWKSERDEFLKKLKEKTTSKAISEIVNDVVDNVKSPQPPLPDVSIPQIAQRQFEKKNFNKRLFYNPTVHKWFNKLFRDVWIYKGHPEEHLYWDQSTDTIKNLIKSVQDPVTKTCFERRLQNYCHLSIEPSPNKSQLYSSVKNFISETAFKTGGDLADQVKKELDMWEVSFTEPTQEQGQAEIKARQQQIAKIKAEWLKKAKKKKWTPQDEQDMIKQYKGKLQGKATTDLLQKFNGFDSQANFIKTREKISKKMDTKNYFKFLERLKTVKEFPIDGKKLFIKFNLKLKENCEDKLKELEEYLQKKKQEEIRLEEEKKNQQQKKKKPAPKKKKGQKEEEEQKPLYFDFSSLLQEESWNGLVETLKLVLQKQPFLLLIGCSYGPRSGRFNEKYSVKFLLEHLKTIQSSIQFLPHSELESLGPKLQDQTIGEGSIFFMQNLNFLPSQVMQIEEVNKVQEQVEGQTKVKEVVSSRKLLMNEIRKELDYYMSVIDIVISEDRFSHQASGVTSYCNRQCVLGSLWWKYIGMSLRTRGSYLVIGGTLNPSKLLTISKALGFVQKIYLTGQIGLKFWISKNHSELKLFNTEVSVAEKEGIDFLLSHLEEQGLKDNLIIPSDFRVESKPQEESQQKKIQLYPSEQELEQQKYNIVDVGPKTVACINEISVGNVFILEYPQICCKNNCSLVQIARSIYQKQQQKRSRHQEEQKTSAGINYEADLVTYFVNISDTSIEKIQLVEKVKKQKKLNEDGEQIQEQEEIEPEKEEEENETKKIDLIADYRLDSASCLYKIMTGQFIIGLKDMSRYPKSQ